MTAPSRRFARDTNNKVIAGVCSGLARRFGISRNGLRIAAVVSCILPGPQFIAYVVLWVVMPKG
ncbi:MAG: Phage shock protein PspC [Klenkia sp.]|nr:Phage shock protein PspC [Klenkia sp.]